ncbi:MAG: hypothetical protein IT521_06970 [Burkholderiales bacterium]|nr:hypothetical protein [Burkholderiales bacterium]
MLAAVTLSMLVVTLSDPGSLPLLELVDAVVIAVALLCGFVDLYRFAQGTGARSR